MRAISAKQGNRTVTEYANELKGLWQELDHYRQIEIKCTDDAATLKKITECDRTYDFLAGINQESDQVRVQILCKGTFPALDTVISIVLAEESRRTVMLTSQVSNGSAMILRNGNGRNSQNKDDLVCSYCKKPRHTRGKCWKLHGKPTNMEYGNKQRNSQTHMAVAALLDESKRKSEECNNGKDEGRTSGTNTSIYSGILPYSISLNASDTSYDKPWIIDSGATDHMTFESSLFITYSPCPSTRKVVTADGTLTTVAGIGDVQINSSLTLKNVLHVLKLSTNLISIHKLTHDLCCQVTFNDTYCIF